MGIGLHLYFKNYNYVPISQTGMHTIYLLNYFHCKYHSFLYTTTIVFNYLDMSNKSLGSVCVVISTVLPLLYNKIKLFPHQHTQSLFFYLLLNSLKIILMAKTSIPIISSVLS